MAATPSKLSPTNRPLEGGEDVTGTDTSATAPAASLKDAAVPSPQADTATAEPSAPTYQSVESSVVYLLAKRHLSEGKFEEAMTVIEEGIRDTLALLQKIMNEPDGDFALHESLAPLHYLYGTTLLYAIEEQDQEVTTAGSAVSTAVISGEAAAAAPEEGAEEAQIPMATSAEDIADEMQIAWENFETARHIMETMMASTSSTANESNKEKLELDLAQICLREGDLQRMNGRNENAVQDYEACLKLRKASSFLGKYDRKIADVHYNLGLVYINVASKDDETPDDDDEQAALAGAKATTSNDDDRVKEAKQEMARNKSVYHFLECSKCFSGQIASICNADPASITEVTVNDQDHADSTGGDAKPKANYKTTGEEDDEMELPKEASAKLQTMRSRVAELLKKTTTLNQDLQETVDDLNQLLGDIQETVDEAENSTKGVQEVTNMKAQVSALAAADGEIGEPSSSNDGGTTTIGFGSSTASSAVAVAAASAPVANTSTAAAPARPMMVIKKKKRAPVQAVVGPDIKKPKTAE